MRRPIQGERRYYRVVTFYKAEQEESFNVSRFDDRKAAVEWAESVKTLSPDKSIYLQIYYVEQDHISYYDENGQLHDTPVFWYEEVALNY